MSVMTLYSIEYRDGDSPSGVSVEWFTTWTKAMSRLRRLKLSDSVDIQTHDVPRTKVGLVGWLNEHAK